MQSALLARAAVIIMRAEQKSNFTYSSAEQSGKDSSSGARLRQARSQLGRAGLTSRKLGNCVESVTVAPCYDVSV